MADRLRLPLRPRDEARMTLIEHLGELRSRIIKVAVVFVVAAVVTWFFRERLFFFLLEPAGTEFQGEKLFVTSVGEQFISDMKLALWAAFVVTAVGEMGRVTTYILITLASSLFLAGIAFGYFFVLPAGLQFLLNWATDRYETIITPSFY